MAIYTLTDLKNFSTTISNYKRHEQQNQAYAELAQKEKKKVIDKTEQAKENIDKRLDEIFYKKGAQIFHIVSIALAVILFIGCFTFFNPVLSFDFDDVISAYDEKAKEKPSIIADAFIRSFENAYSDGEGGYLDEPIPGDALDKYEEWRTNECEILIGGCMLWVALIIFGLAIVAMHFAKQRTKPWNPVIGVMGAFAIFYLLCWIVFVCRGAWGDVTGIFSFIGSVFNVILSLVVSPFGAIIFVFRAGYVMALAALLAPVTLALGFIAYRIGYAIFLANNDGLSSTSVEATALVARKNAIIENCPREAEEVYNKIMAKITPNPYQKAKNLIPCDIEKDLYSLIYVWEKGYARDFVGARQFLQQQKNHQDLINQREAHHRAEQRQHAELIQSIDRQTQAIRDAANKEVDVYIHY
jgi:flagellar motility protein MotE (MotC chaperone)